MMNDLAGKQFCPHDGQPCLPQKSILIGRFRKNVGRLSGDYFIADFGTK